jgi:predicted deacylase
MNIRILVTLALFCGTAIASESDTARCENSQLTIDINFAGGELDKCDFTSANSVVLTFQSEDPKVDPSFTWFAFRISADKPVDVDITMLFPTAYARYWPKLSVDGVNWQRASENDVELLDAGKNLQLQAHVNANSLWVSAQELLTTNYYDEWFVALAADQKISTAIIGDSIQGRPIRLAKTKDRPEAVILMGRQHPAEVPGAIAMREFVNAVLGDSSLAQRFRERFTLLIIPLLNPDGVVNGHARHNAGGIDLNRDWGPFTQPETRSVKTLLDSLEEHDTTLRLMLDFHATKMSPTMLFYTQVPEEPTNPLLFADIWLAAVRERVGDYDFIHDARQTSDQFNSKNYFFNRYGIPSITYEIGDIIDRQEISDYTTQFAEEMMREMLKAD